MARRFLPPLVLRIANLVDVDRMVRSLSERIAQLVKIPILDGQLFEGVDATTAGTTVTHGLGRTPRGCILVKADTAATYVFDDFDKVSLVVTASAASTVDLWVF